MRWNGIHPIFLSNISFSIEPKCVMCSCLLFYVCMQTRYVLIWWKDLGTHISQTVFVPASKAPFLECVDGPDDESTGREFNKLIQFGIQSTIERTGDNGNFSSAHCLHTCSRFRQRSTHVLKANEKQAKRARKLCKHLIFIHIQYWHLPIWRGYLRNVVSGWRRRQPKNIVFRMCVYARMHITLLQPSWKLSNEKRMSNEYLIEHSALQRVHIQRHEHWTCVCVCAPAIKRISENE